MLEELLVAETSTVELEHFQLRSFADLASTMMGLCGSIRPCFWQFLIHDNNNITLLIPVEEAIQEVLKTLWVGFNIDSKV